MTRARRAACGAAAAVVAAMLVPVVPASAQDAVGTLPSEQSSCLPPPSGSEHGVPWAQRQLAPQRAWPLSTGEGVTVAVVDTGVDARTPQLAGADVRRGVDVTGRGGGRADTDCYGHGTFVAGIIAAQQRNGTGFAGVAPDVTILPVRCATTVGDDTGPGSLTAEAMAKGIRAGVDGGAEVVNLSASTTERNAGLEAAVRYAQERDVVLVASAANGAQEGDPVTYPASYPGVIAVGAIDSAGQRAEFSQVGPYLSLVAPGVDVVSLGPGGAGQWQGSGTSYSAPFVAATAALVRAYHPELSAEQVKHRLEATADRPPAVVPDEQLGWGTVNPMAAVTTILPEERTGERGRMMAPPAAAKPNIQPPDELGPALAIGGVVGAAVAVFLLVWSARLVSAANRRRWRRP